MSLGRRFIGLGSLAPAGTDVDFLVLAGGGAGGHSPVSYVNVRSGGGGGAGGLRTSYGSTSGGGCSAEAPLSLISGTTYTITVGAGGTSSTSSSTSGSDSSITGSDITDIVSDGGGAGGSRGGNSAQDGGSGGGEAGNTNGPGSGTSCQGYAGRAYSALPQPSTGGGGAGAIGGLKTNGPSPGGNCLAVSITGSSTNYAAGGNSGHNGTGSPAYYQTSPTCGIGGGILGGSINQDGVAASPANRGSGGGGAHGNSSGSLYSGGAGSSGVVILRMPTADYTGTTTGSPSVSTDGSDTILTFTGSGSYTH